MQNEIEPQLVALREEGIEDTALLTFPALSKIDGFAHAISTRPWNVSTRQGADVDRAPVRRRQICQHLGLDFDRLTVPNQVHSPHVLPITGTDIGAGRSHHDDAINFCDGLVCDRPGVSILQFSADCPIVVVVDPKRRVFGTAHSSWRGTVAGITTELLRQLVARFGVDAADLIAAIGPCAGPTEYEVGEDVRRVADARLAGADRFFHRVDGRLMFDMRTANVAQLIDGGLSAAHIHVANHSTMSDSRFYSHRRDGAATGRFGLFAGFRS